MRPVEALKKIMPTCRPEYVGAFEKGEQEMREKAQVTQPSAGERMAGTMPDRIFEIAQKIGIELVHVGLPGVDLPTLPPQIP